MRYEIMIFYRKTYNNFKACLALALKKNDRHYKILDALITHSLIHVI